MAFLNALKLIADATAASVAVERTGLFVGSLKGNVQVASRWNCLHLSSY